MSQHDYEITKEDANTGSTFRAALNTALQALASNNSGEFEPVIPYGGMWWISIADGIVKQRNVANDAWIDKFSVDDELAPYSSIAVLEAAFNFLGLWADQVGALAVPASVYHLDKQWQLLEDLPDVTLSEPGTDPEWLDISLAFSTHAATSKPTPVDLDEFPLTDSADTFSLKKLTFANLKSTILSTWKDTTGGLVGLTLFKINFKNVADTFTSFFTNSNTAARTYIFQDRDGTIADDTDIADLLSLVSQENYCINGTSDIWKRATSQTTSGYDSDDRWYNYHADIGAGSKTHTQGIFAPGQTDVPDSPKFYSSTVVVTGNLSSEEVVKLQRLIDPRRFFGKTVAVSFYAKADSVKDMTIVLKQRYNSTFQTPVSEKITLSAAWQKFTVLLVAPSFTTGTIADTDYTQFAFFLSSGSDSDVESLFLGNQSGTFDISEVSIYISDKELPVRRPTAEETLQECLAYYETGAGSFIGGNSGSWQPGSVNFSAKKTLSPLILIYSIDGVTLNKVSFASTLITDAGTNVTAKRSDAEGIYGVGVTGTSAAISYVYNWIAESEL